MNANDPVEQTASIITRPRADYGVRITGHPIAVDGTIRVLDAHARISQDRDALLAAAEALVAAKANQMETIVEWKALRSAIRNARK